MSRSGAREPAISWDVADLAFWLLGPFVVTNRGTPIPMSEGRQRVLLILLEHANRTIASRELIERLWPRHSLEGGRHLLHTYVWALRRTLDRRQQGLIRYSARGYCISVDNSQVDARRFMALVRTGQEQLEAGQLGAAKSFLRTALSLWRSDLPSLLNEDTALMQFASRLRSARSVAQEAYNSTRLLLGEHRLMLVELEHLVAEQPRNEVLVSQLMLAQYRSGHQIAALDAFDACSRALADRGLVPGPDLLAVEVGIVRHERSVVAPTVAPAPPPAVPAGHAVGAVGAAIVADDPPTLGYPRRPEIDLLIADAGGFPVEPPGGPPVASFGDVAAAVQWAQLMQAALTRRDGAGIALGLWLMKPRTVCQLPAAHHAALRLAEAAQRGQLLLSGEVGAFPERVPPELDVRRVPSERLLGLGLDEPPTVVEVLARPRR